MSPRAGRTEAVELVQAECARFGVPGAAVAVVAGGDVVLAEGFGQRDGSRPVTPRTLFMLASDTKCLAAATLCLLVQDGALDLDQPVRDHLPWFAMHDDSLSGQVTSRDLLAHRTGLATHALMTIGDGAFAISNEDVARRVRFLEASRPFREGFGYSNVHYATAGHVAEAVSGQPWRHLLADRLLAPLGMTGTSTYSPELTCGDFAAPHAGGVRLPFQTRAYDLPSGGVVTHAEDLARWLLGRLGRGALDDALLGMLHAPVVAVDGALPFPEVESSHYALGNMAVSYRGHRLHLHGGSQIGFASQVMVVPEAAVGVAVMTNTHGSALPLALGLSLVDQLLDLEPVPWGARLAAAPRPEPPPAASDGLPAQDLQARVGSFHHPAYGDLSLTLRDGALAAGFHGLDDQLLLTHLGGDDWSLSITGVPELRAPLSFRTGPDGSVTDVLLTVDPMLAPVAFPRR